MSNKGTFGRQRSRNSNRKQFKVYRGGFIRDNVPQFAEYCDTNGTNPLYEPLPNPQTCTGCGFKSPMTGGRKSAKKRSRSLKKNRQQQRGGFIRDNVPQFSEYCTKGINPLYEPLPNPQTCTSCDFKLPSLSQTGGRKKRSNKKQNNNRFQYWF